MFLFLNKHKKAQAATELAVFGAVLVFLIGGIVRNSVSASQQQNVQLKAMRMALLQSYNDSLTRTVGRMNSSVIYLEDRLSPDISRYGNSDRTQLFTMGSGMLTNLLYYPLEGSELSDARNFPTTDLYVNGVHIPLTTAALVPKTFDPPAGFQRSYSGTPVAITPTNPDDTSITRYKGWEFQCLRTTSDPLVNPVVETWHGCPLFYNQSTNADQGVLTDKEAYDLNRNDIFTDDPQVAAANGKLARADMAWHWKAVRAIDLNVDVGNSTNTSFDLDNDGQDEQIYAYNVDANGIASSATVMDNQEGDYDGSVEYINGRTPGLQREMSILTQTKPGTYFEVKEGKLYNPEDGQYARSTGVKNQVELVQRMFQLTRDTQRFCVNGVPRATLPDNTENPVEACGGGGILGGSSCFSGDNIKLTCFDTDSKMLYIRTRVLDKTGHAWLTDTKGKLP